MPVSNGIDESIRPKKIYHTPGQKWLTDLAMSIIFKDYLCLFTNSTYFGQRLKNQNYQSLCRQLTAVVITFFPFVHTFSINLRFRRLLLI